jgi:hypothetical protein
MVKGVADVDGKSFRYLEHGKFTEMDMPWGFRMPVMVSLENILGVQMTSSWDVGR